MIVHPPNHVENGKCPLQAGVPQQYERIEAAVMNTLRQHGYHKHPAARQDNKVVK